MLQGHFHINADMLATTHDLTNVGILCDRSFNGNVNRCDLYPDHIGTELLKIMNIYDHSRIAILLSSQPYIIAAAFNFIYNTLYIKSLRR